MSNVPKKNLLQQAIGEAFSSDDNMVSYNLADLSTLDNDRDPDPDAYEKFSYLLIDSILQLHDVWSRVKGYPSENECVRGFASLCGSFLAISMITSGKDDRDAEIRRRPLANPHMTKSLHRMFKMLEKMDVPDVDYDYSPRSGKFMIMTDNPHALISSMRDFMEEEGIACLDDFSESVFSKPCADNQKKQGSLLYLPSGTHCSARNAFLMENIMQDNNVAPISPNHLEAVLLQCFPANHKKLVCLGPDILQ